MGGLHIKSRSTLHGAIFVQYFVRSACGYAALQLLSLVSSNSMHELVARSCRSYLTGTQLLYVHLNCFVLECRHPVACSCCRMLKILMYLMHTVCARCVLQLAGMNAEYISMSCALRTYKKPSDLLISLASICAKSQIPVYFWVTLRRIRHCLRQLICAYACKLQLKL